MKFLIFVDDSGRIEDIKWSFDKSIFAIGSNIQDYFAKDSERLIREMIHDSNDGKGYSSVTTQMYLADRTLTVILYSLKLYDIILVFGFDNAPSDINANNEFVYIYNDFANKVREEFRKTIRAREDSIREKFEEIHRLNNELINTRRLLEKANAKLDSANRDLTRRLIKDPLTGLVSRYQYWAEVERMIYEAPGKFGVFTYIDLDGFKLVNDTYGHAAGDKYLIEFARRLKNISLANTIKIRVAGDEFALYTHGLEAVDDKFIQSIWNEIQLKALSTPIEFDNIALPSALSAGMAVYGEDANTINELIEYADFAMYQSKRKGKCRYTRFDRKQYDERRK